MNEHDSNIIALRNRLRPHLVEAIELGRIYADPNPDPDAIDPDPDEFGDMTEDECAAAAKLGRYYWHEHGDGFQAHCRVIGLGVRVVFAVGKSRFLATMARDAVGAVWGTWGDDFASPRNYKLLRELEDTARAFTMQQLLLVEGGKKP